MALFFGTIRITNRTIPRERAIDKSYAALQKHFITVPEKWTEILTLTSKSLTKILNNHYQTLTQDTEQRKTELTPQVTTTLQTAPEDICAKP